MRAGVGVVRGVAPDGVVDVRVVGVGVGVHVIGAGGRGVVISV